MSAIKKKPVVIWALGDREQSTHSGITVESRAIYYKGKRVGEIHPDYSEPLMRALLKVESAQDKVLWLNVQQLTAENAMLRKQLAKRSAK